MNINALFTGLTQMKHEELRQIDLVCAAACDKVCQQLESIGVKLRLAAIQAIDAALVVADDLAPPSLENTMAKLGRSTAAAVQEAGREQANALQLELQRDLAAEINRLYAFATTVDQIAQFMQRSLVNAPPPNGSVSLVKQLEPLWAEYRDGGQASRHTDFGAGLLIAALGGPALTQALLVLKPELPPPSLEVETFKQSYQAAVRTEIDRHWQASRVHTEQAVADHITELFNRLKTPLDRALDEHRCRLSNLPASAFAAPSSPAVTEAPAEIAKPTSPSAKRTPEEIQAQREEFLARKATRAMAEEKPTPLQEPKTTPTCSQCDAALNPGARFCGECGAPVGPAQPTPSPVTAACPQCGRALKIGIRFCGGCGYQTQ